MKTLEYFEKIVELIKENPNAEVRVVVDTDNLNEDYNWCLLNVCGEPKIENLVQINERIYDEDQYEDAIEQLMYNQEDKSLSDENSESLAITEYEKLMKPTIVIRTT